VQAGIECTVRYRLVEFVGSVEFVESVEFVGLIEFVPMLCGSLGCGGIRFVEFVGSVWRLLC